MPLKALATGTIQVKLYKGAIHFESASDVSHQLYSESNASMEAIGDYNHADSEGFLRVLQVSAKSLAANQQITPPAWLSM
jgi:argininosuccinate synthase